MKMMFMHLSYQPVLPDLSMQAPSGNRERKKSISIEQLQCRVVLREGFKNPSHGICPLGGYPSPPPLNGLENLAKKVNGKGGYPPSPHSGRIFF